MRRIHANEGRNVDVDESGHQVLTVKAVHDSAMTGNNISKILLKTEFRISAYEMIVLSNKKKQLKYFTLILKARLNPLAKKPPKGPMTELNTDIDRECRRKGMIVRVFFPVSCKDRIIISSNQVIVRGRINNGEHTIRTRGAKDAGTEYS